MGGQHPDWRRSEKKCIRPADGGLWGGCCRKQGEREKVVKGGQENLARGIKRQKKEVQE